MKNKLRLYWKPLFAVMVWGASFVATKIALSELTPLTIVLSRLIMGVLLLAVIIFIKDGKFTIPPQVLKNIVLLALVASFHLWIQVTGLQFTTASNTGWIIGFSPVFMAILGVMFFHESLNFIRSCGIVISLFGLLLLVSKGNFKNIGLISNLGDLLVLASAVTWSVYSALNKKISLHYSPLLTIFYLFSFMSLFLIPFTIRPEGINSVIHLSLKGWLAIAFLGIFCSGIAYVLWAQALREMDSANVGVFLYFEPFVTVFTAWIILGENITFLTILSGIIITLGVVFVNRKAGASG
ncbi:MAG: DMT family transporter [Ignavibacteria bacterium]|jgi:drug/metabolite transporter (DMT)-like permease|nr:DMT family transporter [Ignavibacteria bacterium]MCU7504447.1 DMT family transporter [Ignavibacteria bacterium]MCU7517462.1 DMT family transporter [Ignavibacteria bacterium]